MHRVSCLAHAHSVDICNTKQARCSRLQSLPQSGLVLMVVLHSATLIDDQKYCPCALPTILQPAVPSTPSSIFTCRVGTPRVGRANGSSHPLLPTRFTARRELPVLPARSVEKTCGIVQPPGRFPCVLVTKVVENIINFVRALVRKLSSNDSLHPPAVVGAGVLKAVQGILYFVVVYWRLPFSCTKC